MFGFKMYVYTVLFYVSEGKQQYATPAPFYIL